MFTPERLILARKRRRMTLAALSREAGVSVQSITAFENGRKAPSAETLSSLAASLRYPVAFFTAPSLDEMQPDSVSFRAPSKMSALERDSTLASGTIARLLNSWIEDHFKLPEPNVPTYPHLAPEEAAEQVRAYWGVGEAPIPNVIRLLESNGVRVFSLAEDCLDADAFSTIKSGTPFIFLNTRKNGERGRFDASHELGHLILHCEHRIPHGTTQEVDANYFASAFLMPRAAIFAQSLNNASIDRILLAKKKWGVSAMALTYRLRSLGLLTQWRYNQTVKELAKRGYRSSEPNSSLVRESSRLLSKVFDNLRRRKISPADIAKEINIPIDEMNDYVFGLAPIQVIGGGERSASSPPNLQVVAR